METQGLTKYGAIARRWWWVVVLVFVATIASMLAFRLLAETEYKATATVQVTAPPPQEVPLYSTYGRQAVEDEIAQTRSSFREFLLEGSVVYRVLEKLPDVPMKGGELRDRLGVEIPVDSQLVLISVKAAEPELAAVLANEVATTGLSQYAELTAGPTAGTRRFIEQQLEVAQSEYEQAEAALTEFQVVNKISSLDTAINQQYDLVATLKLQRDLAWAGGETDKAQALEETTLEREAELQNLIGLSAQYYALVSQVDRAQETYRYLLDRKAEAQLKESQILELGSIQVITPALPPTRPVPAIDNKLMALGAGASLIAGVLLALTLEYIDSLAVARASTGRIKEAHVAKPVAEKSR
jgi:uncharacterized protein involved in exopolysaccharide biosynthesis